MWAPPGGGDGVYPGQAGPRAVPLPDQGEQERGYHPVSAGPRRGRPGVRQVEEAGADRTVLLSSPHEQVHVWMYQSAEQSDISLGKWSRL